MYAAFGTLLLAGGYRIHAQEKEDAAAKEAAKSAAEIRARYAKYEFRIPMRDGVKLFTAVYVPKDATPARGKSGYDEYVSDPDHPIRSLKRKVPAYLRRI